MEGQRAAVQAFIAGRAGALLAEHREIESGEVNSRPELARALELCRLTGASLVVAKIDRLSRDAHSCSACSGRTCRSPSPTCRMPTSSQWGILGLVAQRERQLISQRTKAALAAAKARGVKLGGYRGGPLPDVLEAAAARGAKADAFAGRVAPIAREIQAEGKGLEAIAAELTRRGIKTARGGRWAAQTVKNLLAREIAQ